MLKLKLSFLFATIFFTNYNKVSVIEYCPKYETAVIKLAKDNFNNIFGPIQELTKNNASTDKLMTTEIKESLDKPNFTTKILLDNNKVIGFINFGKTKEENLEDIKEELKAYGLNVEDSQILSLLPNTKNKNDKIKEIVKIEILAVDKDHRRKGYGKKLMEEALKQISKDFKDIDTITVDVLENNTSAKALYESFGFKKFQEDNFYNCSNIKILSYKKDNLHGANKQPRKK